MNRYDKSMMETAKIWAKESSCTRKKVGAILAKGGRIISIGYNGTVSGSENCCEELSHYELQCSRCSCKIQERLSYDSNSILVDKFQNYCRDCLYIGYVTKSPILKSKAAVVHAEANCILFAASEGIPTKDCTLYITLSPCMECSKMIIQSSIKRVVYLESYNDDPGTKFLKENGVRVDQI